MSKFDLLYYCDSYPAIGNGHLKRCLDIIQYILKSTSHTKIGVTGYFSMRAKNFLTNHLPESVSTFLDETPDKRTKLAILDTIFPGDANTIPQIKCNQLAQISDQVFTFNTGIEKTFVPECIDGIFNHIPVTTYYGNIDFKKYFGPKYSPVDPDFHPGEDKWNQNILVMLGGNQDQYGPKILTEKLSKTINSNYEIDFILSPHYPEDKKQKLKENYSRINFYQNVNSVVPFMKNCQALICTYGNTTWEGLTMHKPIYIVSYLDFQKYFAEHLAQEGYAVDLGYLDDLHLEQLNKIKDRNLQKRLVNTTKNKFKKPGIINIANSILEEINVSE